MAGNIVDTLRYVLGMDTKDFDAKATAAEKKIGGMASGFSSLTKVVGGVAAAFGAWKIVDFIKDATLTAARTEVLGTVVHQVGEGAGYSTPYIDKLTESIKAMGITTQVSRQAIIRFVQSGLDLSQAAKLARVAQDLAVISGQNSSQALETIVQAIAAQRPILLKQFGIVENLTVIYGKLAKELGKTANQLTEHEKKQAFINIIMEQGTKVAGSYAAAMEDAGKQLTSLPRYFEELENVIGDIFLPTFGEAIKIITEGLKNIRNSMIEDDQFLNEQVATYEQKLSGLKDILPGLVSQFEALSAVTNRTTKQDADLFALQSKINNLAPGLIKGVNSEGIALGVTTDALKAYLTEKEGELQYLKFGLETARALRVSELKDQIKFYEDQLALRKKYEKGGALASLPDANKALRDLATADEVTKKIIDLQNQIAKLQLAMALAGGDYVEQTKKMDTATVKMTEDLEKLIAEAKNLSFPDVSVPLVDSVKDQLDSLQEDFDLNILSAENFIAALVKIRDALILVGAQGTPALKLVLDKLNEIAETSADNILQGLEDFNKATEEQLRNFSPVPDEAEVKESWASITRDVTGSISTIVAHLDTQVGNVMNNIAASIGSFAEGGLAGIVGGVAGVVDTALTIFSGDAERMVASERDLRVAIDNWIETIKNLTFQQQEDFTRIARTIVDDLLSGNIPDRIKGAMDTQPLIDWINDQLYQFGFQIPDNASWDQIIKILLDAASSINGAASNFEAASGADTMQEMKDIIESGNLTYEELMRWFRFWTEEYDLNAQQQLDVLNLINDNYGNQMSAAEWRQLQLDIKHAQEEANQPSKAEDEQTQISRSIARITERQADSLIGILQTIDFHIVSFAQKLMDIFTGIVAGAGAGAAVAGGGTYIFSGDFNFNGPSARGNAKSFFEEVNTQVRARGGVVIRK